MLPRGLLARAALYRDTRNPKHDFTRAHQDLQEVYDIAESSGMRLLVADRGNPPQSLFFKGGSRESSVPEVPPLEKGGGQGGFHCKSM